MCPKHSYTGPGTYRISYIVHSFGWSYADSQEPYISSLDDLEDVLAKDFSVFEVTEIKRIH
jgi:hypothetical protein